MGRAEGSVSVDSVHLEQGLLPEPEWKPGKKEYAVMITLAIISLMVALDATILVSVLPVSLWFLSQLFGFNWQRANMLT